MKTPAQEWECPLCDSHATVIGNAATASSDYDCDKCGKYTFDDYLYGQVFTAQHWEQTRMRLALALQQGVAPVRVFNDEQDIMKAIGGLDQSAADNTN